MLGIIKKLWSAVFDLLLYIDGSDRKSIEQIRTDLAHIETLCAPYCEDDDAEP